MLFQIMLNGESRPNSFDSKKDEQYHIKTARFYAAGANTNIHAQWLRKIEINKKFYNNEQWVLDEDLDAFFKDENNNDRNRIRMGINMIRPTISQYRANAIRMNIGAEVKSISPLAINRREKLLAEKLFLTDLFQQAPVLGGLMKDEYGVGDSRKETEARFNNLFVDEFVDNMNKLLRYVGEYNKFREGQVRVAESLALSGLAVGYGYEHFGHHRFEQLEPEEFFWDRDARNHDLTDASYMGYQKYRNHVDIYERHQNLSRSQKDTIEKYSIQQLDGNFRTQLVGGKKIPTYMVTWLDVEEFWHGYVKDEYGYTYLAKINFKEENQEKPKYTDKDLLPLSELTEYQKKTLRGKNKAKLSLDVIRYCEFIPKEIAMIETYGVKRGDDYGDIVLDYGLWAYQDTCNTDPYSSKFPFKASTWSYIDGIVASPIDDIINPQRLLNRIMSVAENQINNSGGSSFFYDKSMIDPQDGEDSLIRNMYQSKPIGLMTRGMGIPNAHGAYDNTIGNGTMVMFNIIDIVKQKMQEITGVNDAIMGQSQGQDQLVGVTNSLINQGSLIQEPFYNAVSHYYLQLYQSIADVGKRIYSDNERDLAIIIGDDGVGMFKITKDYNAEDFRCFVKRETVDDVQIQNANNQLMTFLQMQLIDNTMFANLWGRSTVTEVNRALRQKASIDAEAARVQAQQQQQMMQQQQQQQEQGMAQMQEMKLQQDGKEELQRQEMMQHDLDKIHAKGIMDSMKQKNDKPQKK